MSRSFPAPSLTSVEDNALDLQAITATCRATNKRCEVLLKAITALPPPSLPSILPLDPVEELEIDRVVASCVEGNRCVSSFLEVAREAIEELRADEILQHLEYCIQGHSREGERWLGDLLSAKTGLSSAGEELEAAMQKFREAERAHLAASKTRDEMVKRLSSSGGGAGAGGATPSRSGAGLIQKFEARASAAAENLESAKFAVENAKKKKNAAVKNWREKKPGLLGKVEAAELHKLRVIQQAGDKLEGCIKKIKKGVRPESNLPPWPPIEAGKEVRLLPFALGHDKWDEVQEQDREYLLKWRLVSSGRKLEEERGDKQKLRTQLESKKEKLEKKIEMLKRERDVVFASGQIQKVETKQSEDLQAGENVILFANGTQLSL